MSLTPSHHDLSLETPWTLGERRSLLLLMVLVPSILVIDELTGPAFSLQLFYVVPVALAAWTLGERTGHVIAAATAASWIFVAISSRAPNEPPGPLVLEIVLTVGLFLFVAHLVGRHRRFVEGLRALARVDNETGALSRREFDRVFEAEVRRARRYRRHMALALFDLGEIRGEGPGHLPAAVRIVQAQLREGDSVGRIAPRRFAAILIECKPPESQLVIQRLRETLVANLRLRAPDLSIVIAAYGGTLPASSASLMTLAEKHVQLARGGSGIAETRID
jgi:GGDEF domain-containing protein